MKEIKIQYEKSMTQIERIRKMEERMDKAAEVLRELSDALDRFADVQDDVRALEGYYASELWKKDFADDEAGLLPANLKRGVLSEDGIWNLLKDMAEAEKRMCRVAEPFRGTPQQM